MGGRGGSSKMQSGLTSKPPQTSTQGTGAPGGQLGGIGAAGNSGGKPTISSSDMTDAEFMSRYKAQNPDRKQKSASYDYTDPRPQANGFAKSQNMNYAIDTSQRLTGKQKAMLDGMESMQAPLPKDTTLHRAAHQDVLQALGVQNYDSMSEAQLKNALVGARWNNKALISTSYDAKKSPFISGPQSGGREVILRIHAAKGTNVTYVNPSQAEVVLGRGANWEVTDAKFTGKRANPRVNRRPGGYKQVILDVDVW